MHLHLLSRSNDICLVAQSCPTLCDPMDCNPPGSSVHGDSPTKNTRVGYQCPPPGDCPNPGIEPRSPSFPLSLSSSLLKIKLTSNPHMIGWIPVWRKGELLTFELLVVMFVYSWCTSGGSTSTILSVSLNPTSCLTMCIKAGEKTF